jgi:ribosomal-protein-alanine N-acetyltransferase
MPRIIIRPPTADDGEAFVAAMRASRKLHGRWLSPPTDHDAYLAYLAQMSERKFIYLGCRRDDGAIVGYAAVSEIVRGGLQSAFLGYGGVAAHTGRGYMTELIQLVITEAFTTLGLHRLEANIQPGNVPSIALAERCGFEKEGFSPRYLKINGRWRDHERWAIRADSVRAAPAKEKQR